LLRIHQHLYEIDLRQGVHLPSYKEDKTVAIENPCRKSARTYFDAKTLPLQTLCPYITTIADDETSAGGVYALSVYSLEYSQSSELLVEK
jgi:hypothetical protein